MNQVSVWTLMQILHYFYLLKTLVSKQIEAQGTCKASIFSFHDRIPNMNVSQKYKKKLPAIQLNISSQYIVKNEWELKV